MLAVGTIRLKNAPYGFVEISIIGIIHFWMYGISDSGLDILNDLMHPGGGCQEFRLNEIGDGKLETVGTLIQIQLFYFMPRNRDGA